MLKSNDTMEENERKSELRMVVIFTALLVAFGVAMLVLTLTVFGKALFWPEVGAKYVGQNGKDCLISYIYDNIDFPLVTIKNFQPNANLLDTISIRVNPANPADITVLQNVWLLVVMFVLSGIMILGGIALPVGYLLKKKAEK